MDAKGLGYIPVISQDHLLSIHILPWSGRGCNGEGERDMGKYVIQRRENHWSNRWVVRSKHETLEEAKTEFAKILFQQEYRIAEAYTVVRYKPVKEVR